MSIQITHNDDGSITAECGEDELTFFPRRKPSKTVVSGSSGSDQPIWAPPIPSGQRHKTFLYVPVGAEDADAPNPFTIDTPTIEWSNPSKFKIDLNHVIRSNRRFGLQAQREVRVMMTTGTKFNVKEIASAADQAIKGTPINLYLSGKLSGK